MNNFSEVHDLLHMYFDTLYYCDLEKFDAVFHSQAIYATADETPLLYRDMTAYRKVIAQRRSPASRSEQRRDFIDAIEFAGDNTALARVRCSIGERDFVDLLSLVQIEGRWRIIAKIFQIIQENGDNNALR
ncbi:MAG: nuclear transport factor 2 family protein [Pseudoalteromonas distincta]